MFAEEEWLPCTKSSYGIADIVLANLPFPYLMQKEFLSTWINILALVREHGFIAGTFYDHKNEGLLEKPLEDNQPSISISAVHQFFNAHHLQVRSLTETDDLNVNPKSKGVRFFHQVQYIVEKIPKGIPLIQFKGHAQQVESEMPQDDNNNNNNISASGH